MSGGFLIDVDYAGPQLDAPDRLTIRTELAGAVIWSDRPVISLGRAGCIIGDLFPKNGDAHAVTELSPSYQTKVVQTAGRSLLNDYWGGYVAVVRGHDGLLAILRDPSATLPCFYSRRGRRWAVSSNARLCLDRLELPIMLEYREIARYLAAIGRTDRSTCVTGVTELLGGECLLLDWDEATRHIWWSPHDHCAPALRYPIGKAAADLHQRIDHVMRCWTSAYSNIVLGVSGGLDSSIVAESCVAAGRPLRLLTMVGPDADGDETRYAGALAAHLQQPLTRRHYQLADIAIGMPAVAHIPRPQGTCFLQSIRRAHGELAEQGPIDAIFTGHGGDNVFCLLRTVAPLLDRMAVAPTGGGALRTLNDLADLAGESVWTIVAAAVRAILRGRPGHGATDVSGLNPDMLGPPRVDGSRHPWLAGTDSIPRGKAAHVAMLASALGTLDWNDRIAHPPQIAPLLSQPVVELCLSIPTWQWIDSGVDRAIARRAFRGLLPDILIDRKSKGGPSGFLLTLFAARSEEVREWLMSGLLVANGVLDPAFVQQAAQSAVETGTNARRLLMFSNAEAWAQSWKTSR